MNLVLAILRFIRLEMKMTRYQYFAIFRLDRNHQLSQQERIYQ